MPLFQRDFSAWSSLSLPQPIPHNLPLFVYYFFSDDFLYWAEAGSNIIGRTDMDGNERTVLFRPRSSPHHFFGLTVFQDMLYITDWRTRTYVHVYSQLQACATEVNSEHVLSFCSYVLMHAFKHKQRWTGNRLSDDFHHKLALPSKLLVFILDLRFY